MITNRLRSLYPGWLLVPFLCLTFFSQSLSAHPLAPGLLVLNETSSNLFQGLWKLPNKTAERGKLAPIFPDQCKLVDLQDPVAAGTGRAQSFKLQCDEIITGKTIGVEGIAANGSGILLRIRFMDGELIHQMLNSQNASVTIPVKQSVTEIFSRYITLGVEHLILGIDHVLFVITLAILVGWTKQLFWTITLFTLGHSVTLSLTALGFIYFPIAFVESMIAFSIAWAAAEIISKKKDGLLQRRPWIMSGGFGLLHGMGFAGALAEIGLPQQALTVSLAAFNIGIELGQLLVIAVYFALIAAIKKLGGSLPSLGKVLIGYAIGITGSLWFWQRLFGI